MPIIILLIIITTISIKYFITKNANKVLKEELTKKQKKEIKSVDLNPADKKFLQNIFNKKINYISFIKKIKHYEFFYRKGETLFGRKNVNFEVIKIRLNKIKIDNETLFKIDVFAWEDKSSFEKEENPDKKVIEVITKKEIFKKQVIFTLEDFFINEFEKEKKTITIDNM